MGFFQRLKEGLKKTSASIANVFKATEITDEFYDDIYSETESSDVQ